MFPTPSHFYHFYNLSTKLSSYFTIFLFSMMKNFGRIDLVVKQRKWPNSIRKILFSYELSSMFTIDIRHLPKRNIRNWNLFVTGHTENASETGMVLTIHAKNVSRNSEMWAGKGKSESVIVVMSYVKHSQSYKTKSEIVRKKKRKSKFTVSTIQRIAYNNNGWHMFCSFGSKTAHPYSLWMLCESNSTAPIICVHCTFSSMRRIVNLRTINNDIWIVENNNNIIWNQFLGGLRHIFFSHIKASPNHFQSFIWFEQYIRLLLFSTIHKSHSNCSSMTFILFIIFINIHLF